MDYKDETLSIEQRVDDLVSRMTIQECCSQMIHNASNIERLGIPYYNWWNEALHGVARAGMATVFPQVIGLAATFDSDLIYRIASVIATEGRAKYNLYQQYGDCGIYKGITFWSPNVNIFRDPRWGRGQETFGEDPFLTSQLGVSFVQGLQQVEAGCMKTSACAKHFAVHSGPENIRHKFNAIVSKQDLTETYLPAFKALVDAGVEGVMGAYNMVNGEPCCGHSSLLVDLLRKSWGFDGYIVSDCWAIADFHVHHHITSSELESIALAVRSGCDLNCGSMYSRLTEAYEKGLIQEKHIRQSTKRLMSTRMKLGMFNKASPYDHLGLEHINSTEHQLINEESARKSLVLLKNDGILPLAKKSIKRILVTGPNANSTAALHGNYYGVDNRYYTVLDSIRSSFPDSKVWFSEGSPVVEKKEYEYGPRGHRLTEVEILADAADVVILVVGLDETVEGEEMVGQEYSGDKKNLLLPLCQRELIMVLCKRKTPIVLINMSGSAIDFGCANTGASAIIQAWYPGALGGRAIADLLAGFFSPSGKLPVTFYKNETVLPPFTDYTMEGRTYKFLREDPLFPFGFGLSYTNFTYNALHLEQKDIVEEAEISGTFSIKNTGKYASDEVAQVYIRNLSSNMRVPHYKLVWYRRVHIPIGEQRDISFSFNAKELMIVDEEGKEMYHYGNFSLFVGGHQPDSLSSTLSDSHVLELSCTLRKTRKSL